MASDTASDTQPPEWFAPLERRFDLRCELGRGRHKSVYLAWDRSLERQVAIASIESTHLDGAVASRLQEARAMARIGDHPRIVSVYDVIELNERILIVSQFVSGGDLRSRLDGAGELLPASWCVDIAADIAEALGHAHGNQMIHRDVKPGNVFLDAGDRALLGDLGLSEILSGSRGDEPSVRGTLPYVSPEQLLGEHAGPPSDTYSLGCVLYEMLAGFPPFRAQSAAELVSNIVGAPPRPLREARPDLPPVLDDVVMQSLHKDPAKRPISCRELAEVLRTIRAHSFRHATVDGTRARDCSPESVPVFGFEANLKIIAKAASDLGAGAPGVLLVEGEAGTGKTRLLRELTHTAESMGCTVLQASASDAGYLPLQPIATALRPLLTRIPERGPISGLRRLIDGDTEPVFAPELSTTQETGWFAAVTMLLDEVASERPVVLSIDDLHCADSASVSVLQHLMNHLAQPGAPPLLIAIAARATNSAELVERMQRLRHSAVATRLSLERLNDRAIRQIIEARGVPSPSAQLVRHVESVSCGNPRLAHEVVSSLLAAGAIESQGGFSVARPDFVAANTQQGTIGAFVESKLNRLTAKSLEALQVLSAFGTTASTAAVAAILGEDIDDVRSSLDPAVAAELVFQEFDRYRFAYLDLRQAVYSEIPESEREATHLAIAHYLQALDPDCGDFSAASVAAHLVRAGTRSDPEELIRTCSEAANTAMHRFAWPEAASLLETALSKSGEADELPSDALAELHRRAGIAHFHLYDKGPSIHHLDLAIEILRECDDQRALIVALNDRARAAIQSGMVAYGELQSIEPLESTLAKLRDEDENLTAVVLGTLAESYWNAQRTERATELAEEALSIARDSENARLVAEMCIHRALGHLQCLELREAVEIYEEGIDAARSTSHLTALEQCLTRHSMVSLLLGKTAAAEAAAVEAQRLNRITHSGDESWSHSTLTTLGLIRGDHEAVEAQADEGIELLRRAKYPWSAAVLLVALAGSRAYRGEADAARRAIALLLEPGFVLEDVSPLEAYSQQHLALIAAYSGEPATPVELFDLASQINIEAGYDFALLPVFCAAIELWSLDLAPQPSAATVRAIELAYNRGVLFSVGWPFFIPRMLAVAALNEGNLVEAVRYGQKALDAARRIRAAPEIARSALDLARALRLRGQDGDHARAQKLLDKQRQVIDEHCPPGLRSKLLPAVADLAHSAAHDRHISSSR